MEFKASRALAFFILQNFLHHHGNYLSVLNVYATTLFSLSFWQILQEVLL